MKPSSFLWGGFECADHINRSGNRVNLLRETQHDVRVEEDYQLLHGLGIDTVREGICWSQVEQTPGVYDFSEVLNRITVADKLGVKQVWDLIHFGYPDGLYPTHPHFCDRFVSLCKAFALFHQAATNRPLLVVPINEISFLSWHSGDVRGTVPFMVNSGWDIKYHLCKAAILGIKAIKDICHDSTIFLVEPLVKVHGDCAQTAACNEHQFQAMDIILGRICPELGGNESLADIFGFNYYWNCQWALSSEPLAWPDCENKRVPLHAMLEDAYARYGMPVLLSETGHFGHGRVQWFKEVIEQCHLAMRSGVPLKGICIYPVTDRPDWDDLSSYSNCGIWDLDENKNRIPCDDYISAINDAQFAGQISISHKNIPASNLKF